MKILHTSDWHIGKQLYGNKRYQEFEEFLDWIVKIISDEEIDILLISGDIFDTTTPSNRAVEIYFNFLFKVAKAKVCKHIVVTAGNHDSPSFLEAPKEVLKFLNVYVVARVDNLEEEVLKLRVDDSEVIICAVPYLRDRDLRDSEYGESVETKEKKVIEAIKRHYQEVSKLAKQKQDKSQKIVAMGHMFVAGENTKIGDGVRELYVGSLGYVGADIFDKNFDYVALGHLHIPQSVGENEYIRYSGSPLAMGFNEAKQQKSITILEIDKDIEIKTINVPKFQELEQIKGNLEKIEKRLKELIAKDISIWVEVVYESSEVAGNLTDIIDKILDGSKVEVLRVKNRTYNTRALQKEDTTKSLEDLDIYEVFDRCLDFNEVDESQRDELKALYKEMVIRVQEES